MKYTLEIHTTSGKSRHYQEIHTVDEGVKWLGTCMQPLIDMGYHVESTQIKGNTFIVVMV